MPVDAPYAEYTEREPDWKVCRDLLGGERKIKDAGATYLPVPEGMRGERAAYAAYVERADFFNGYSRAVSGLHGMVFRKDPVIEYPPAMEEFVEAAAQNGRSMDRVSRWTFREDLSMGRVGLLVDAPRSDGRQLTAREARQLRLSPYVVTYTAEDVLEIMYERVRGRRTLTRVRLAERHVEVDPDDEFSLIEIKRYRVLELVDGVYQQRLFEEERSVRGPTGTAARGEMREVMEPTVPVTAMGAPLDYIPFVAIDADGEPDDGSIAEPPMLDLARKTISLYRTLADWEHGAHYVGFPQACTRFLNAENLADVRVGGPALWDFQHENGDAWYMHHGGEGLGALEHLADRKRQEIALLGARMLEPDRRAVEAAATATIHRQGEMSILQSLAMHVSDGLTRVMEIARDFMGVSGDVSVQLNQDYIPTPMTPQMLKELVAAHMAAEMTDEEFYEALIKGEVVSGTLTIEERQAALSEQRLQFQPGPMDVDVAAEDAELEAAE